jgi:hypothetical protein
MDQKTILLIAAIVVVLAIAAVVWLWLRRRRSEMLRRRFGPEYQRLVEQTGDVRKAEAELEARQRRVAKFPIRPLPAADQTRYLESWRQVQARFVDDPNGAVADGNRLVKEVVQARGYPMSDFEQRAADISVDHPTVISNYRAAREIAQKSASGQATTEELRQALVYYRALFEELLEAPEAIKKEASR